MSIVMLKQKMSGTGTIHDLESDQYDITIDMGTRYKFAVGGPSYYNLGWTRHESEAAALQQYGKLKKAGYEGIVILEASGNAAENLMAQHHGY